MGSNEKPLSQRKAKQIYQEADRIDQEELKGRRYEFRKVRIESVLEATGKKLETLLAQIKNG